MPTNPGLDPKSGAGAQPRHHFTQLDSKDRMPTSAP